MLQAEFTTRTGIKVTAEEFESIHELYMSTDLEKDAFCEAYKTNNPLLQELAKQTRRAKELALERKAMANFLVEQAHECSSTAVRAKAIEMLGAKGYIKAIMEKGYNLWDIDRQLIIETL